MIALIQRVSEAQVKIEDKEIASIGKGFLILLGVISGDNDADLEYLVKKVTKLRIMADKEEKMNLDLMAVGGLVLSRPPSRPLVRNTIASLLMVYRPLACRLKQVNLAPTWPSAWLMTVQRPLSSTVRISHDHHYLRFFKCPLPDFAD